MAWSGWTYINAARLTAQRVESVTGAIDSALVSSEAVQAWIALGNTVAAEPIAPFPDIPSMRFDCALYVASSTSLVLERRGGSQIFIDGKNYPIGTMTTGPYIQNITIGNATITAATIYYVYAYWNGLVVLEFSTTGPAIDLTYGHFIKTGDPTRTYVGRIYAGAGSPGTFVDSPTQRFCASFYNRIPKHCQRQLSTNRTTTSAPWVEINSADRIEFISEGDEYCSTWLGADVTISAVGTVYGSIGIGGIATRINVRGIIPAGIASPASMAGQIGYQFAAGYNYLTLVGGVDGGFTATYLADRASFGAVLRQ